MEGMIFLIVQWQSDLRSQYDSPAGLQYRNLYNEATTTSGG